MKPPHRIMVAGHTYVRTPGICKATAFAVLMLLVAILGFLAGGSVCAFGWNGT